MVATLHQCTPVSAKWNCSVMSDSLWPHGLYSPWNSPGQNTRVSSLCLLQGIFPTQGSNPCLPDCRWILYHWATWEALFNLLIFNKKWKSLSCVLLFMTAWTIQSMESSRPEYWSGYPLPSPGDLPNPGIKPRSPTLQTDSLPTELSGKPKHYLLPISS